MAHDAPGGRCLPRPAGLGTRTVNARCGQGRYAHAANPGACVRGGADRELLAFAQYLETTGWVRSEATRQLAGRSGSPADFRRRAILRRAAHARRAPDPAAPTTLRAHES